MASRAAESAIKSMGVSLQRSDFDPDYRINGRSPETYLLDGVLRLIEILAQAIPITIAV
jgi:hypothetical protein